MLKTMGTSDTASGPPTQQRTIKPVTRGFVVSGAGFEPPPFGL
jgi:hypothetical protein